MIRAISLPSMRSITTLSTARSPRVDRMVPFPFGTKRRKPGKWRELWESQELIVRLKAFPKWDQSITAGKFNSNGSRFAYAVCYDWSKGLEGFKESKQLNHKPHLMIHNVQEVEIRPKRMWWYLFSFNEGIAYWKNEMHVSIAAVSIMRLVPATYCIDLFSKYCRFSDKIVIFSTMLHSFLLFLLLLN